MGKKEIRQRRLGQLPKVTQVASGRARIQSQGVWLQSLA